MNKIRYFLFFYLIHLTSIAQLCDDRKWSGVAKYHTVTNATTACGYSPMVGDTLYAALRETDYQSERLCNTCLKVSSSKGSVVVKVMDQSGSHGLDLHKKVFAKLGDTLVGNVNVTWQITNCPEQGNIGYFYSKDSDISEKKVMIVNTKSTIQKLFFRYKKNDFKEIFRPTTNGNDFFVIPWTDDKNLGPYDFKIVDIYNETIIDNTIEFKANTTFFGQNQFVGCDSTIGINNKIVTPQFIIFKNPMRNNGSIYIKTELKELFTLHLHSLEGRKILETKLESNTHKYLFQNIQKGTYIISVWNSNRHALNKKIVIQ